MLFVHVCQDTKVQVDWLRNVQSYALLSSSYANVNLNCVIIELLNTHTHTHTHVHKTSVYIFMIPLQSRPRGGDNGYNFP
jgi:hypothetical protein